MSTVNRELAYIRTIFNPARESGKAENYPCKKGVMLKENDIRAPVLCFEEFARLLVQCPPHLKPIIMLSYYTP